MKDKRGALEYGFLTATSTGYSEVTYKEEKEGIDYFLEIGVFTKERYMERVAELKKKYNIED